MHTPDRHRPASRRIVRAERRARTRPDESVARAAREDLPPGWLEVARLVAPRLPKLVEALVVLVAMLAALGVVLVIALVEPGRLNAGLVAALVGGAALAGRRRRRAPGDVARSLSRRQASPRSRDACT